MSIRRRLALAYLAVTAAGFLYLVRWVISDIRPYYLTSIEESLVDTTRILASLLSNKIHEGHIDARDLNEALGRAYRSQFSARIYEQTKSSFDLRAYVTNEKGIVIFDSQGLLKGRDYSRWNDVYLTLKGKYGARTTRDDPDDPSSAVIYVAAPIVSQDRIAGVLTLGRPVRSIDSIAKATSRRIVVAGIVATATVFLLFLALSSWLTKPVAQLIQYAEDSAAGKPCSLPDLGKNEIGKLGAAFHRMRTALENRQYVENYVASLTHELKGPLAGLRGAAELLEEDMPAAQRRRFISNIVNETNRIKNLADHLLYLSVLENQGQLSAMSPANLSDICREAEAELAPLSTSQRVAVDLLLEPRLPVNGDGYLMKQAIRNLLQNAIEFSPEGAHVRFRAVASGQQAVVTVEDDGPGIPAFAREKVFQRFFSLPRPGTGAKSSGLGLAIAREVCRLHSGDLQIETREGGGVTALLSIPLARSENSP